MADEYYEISPKVNDIDFYIGGVKVETYIQVNSQVESSAVRVACVSSSIAIESSFDTPFLRKIVEIQSDIEIEVIKETTPLEILNALLIVHIQSELTGTTQKIAEASSIISIQSSLSTLAQKITKFTADAHILSSSATSAVKLTLMKSVASISFATDFRSKSIASLEVQLPIITKTLVKPPIRLSPSYIDDTSIRTLFTLDNKPLTNHNRNFDASLSPLFIENKNWDNRSNRYYKRATSSGRRTFNLSWTMLPNALEDTVDQKHGRDFLNSIAEDPDAHVLKVLNQDENGVTAYTETSYTVFVRSYSETLVRRYINEGVYLYDCNLSLEEV
jgi:hypothetical protein